MIWILWSNVWFRTGRSRDIWREKLRRGAREISWVGRGYGTQILPGPIIKPPYYSVLDIVIRNSILHICIDVVSFTLDRDSWVYWLLSSHRSISCVFQTTKRINISLLFTIDNSWTTTELRAKTQITVELHAVFHWVHVRSTSYCTISQIKYNIRYDNKWIK